MAILTTHTGSLPRLAALDACFAAASRDEPVDRTEMAELVAASTEASVAAQAEVGLDIVNNGEAARESFFTYVRERMSGFDGHSNRSIMADRVAFPSFVELKSAARSRDRVSAMSAPACCGPVRHLGLGPIDDELDGFERALAAVGADVVDRFCTAASPGIVAAAMDDRHYGDDRAYIGAVAEALAPEYRRIQERGLLLQIDAPDLAMERHTRFADRPLGDFLRFAATVVEAINTATAGLDADRLRLHVCWGNYDGPHHLDVALADILPVLLDARVGYLVLPFANPRHAHEHRLLSRLPDSMAVVAGVVETTHNYVEHPEVVADRLTAVADSIGDPGRVQAGTDCGFATFAGYAEVAREVAWEKLRSLVAGAALASQRLGS
jgi:5-methyltetrahydropteroyltriglutamate--homocysteine methyltransferase